jgi:hypothetical protein
MRTMLTICLLLSFSALLLGQEANQPKAIPSRRLVTRGEMYSPLQEIYLDLEGSASKPGDMIAMRICSREPLPLAMFLSVVSPVGIGERIARESINGRLFFSPDQIMILRSADCPVTHPPYVPLEFWGVPKGAALPPSVESVKLCQIKVESIGSEENLKTNLSFNEALRKLESGLRANPEAVGIIRGYYNNRPSRIMRHNIREAQRILGQSGLSRNRYFIRLIPSAGYDSSYPEPEPKYPDISIVRIKRDCNVE